MQHVSFHLIPRIRRSGFRHGEALSNRTLKSPFILFYYFYTDMFTDICIACSFVTFQIKITTTIWIVINGNKANAQISLFELNNRCG